MSQTKAMMMLAPKQSKSDNQHFLIMLSYGALYIKLQFSMIQSLNQSSTVHSKSIQFFTFYDADFW